MLEPLIKLKQENQERYARLRQMDDKLTDLDQLRNLLIKAFHTQESTETSLSKPHKSTSTLLTSFQTTSKDFHAETNLLTKSNNWPLNFKPLSTEAEKHSPSVRDSLFQVGGDTESLTNSPIHKDERPLVRAAKLNTNQSVPKNSPDQKSLKSNQQYNIHKYTDLWPLKVVLPIY